MPDQYIALFTKSLETQVSQLSLTVMLAGIVCVILLSFLYLPSFRQRNRELHLQNELLNKLNHTIEMNTKAAEKQARAFDDLHNSLSNRRRFLGIF